MAKKKTDPLMIEMERSLCPGDFISYNRSFAFVSELEGLKKKIDVLIIEGEAERAVGLLEMFLAGCYEKIEEVDDSGGTLGDFWGELFVSWIKARQNAGRPAGETIQQIFNWMENDDYGFCYEIEREIAPALGKEEYSLFKKHYEDLFDKEYSAFSGESPRPVSEYTPALRNIVISLKKIYCARKSIASLIALFERIEAVPKDCEDLAILLKSKGRYKDALEWVEKGIAKRKVRDWSGNDAYGLSTLKQELLNKTGCGEEALEGAWEDYKAHPSIYSYENLMKYVPEKEYVVWHEKVMSVAKNSSLSSCIDICAETKEWDILAHRIEAADINEIEKFSHYITEKAAKGLTKNHGLSTAKIYTAMGLRIVNAKKSKYYHISLDHFRKAKNLYEKHNGDEIWLSIAERIIADHSRKSGFMPGFKKILSNSVPERKETFHEKIKKRWDKQISD